LDLLSANMGPTMVGHCHPVVTEAVTAQLAKLSSCRILFDNEAQVEYCNDLAKVSPFEESMTYLCPGGGEANEAAIKLAILLTGRPGVLGLEGAYHGQSIGTMSLCGMPSFRERIPPSLRLAAFEQIVPGHQYRPWTESELSWAESLAALEERLEKKCDVAALIIEPIQAVAGHMLFEPEFIVALRDLCKRYGIIIIADEIQTALGRCGEMWASDIYGIAPDMITIGKGAGGGLPFGAVMVNATLIDEGVERQPWHILTAQGNPLQAAAGRAVLQIIHDEDLVQRSRSLGAVATARFEEFAATREIVGDVRGPGLFIGVDLVTDRETREPATEACVGAFELGLELGIITDFSGVGANVLKFKPPLTVSDADFEIMLEKVELLIDTIAERQVSSRSN
jgi:4-aminobutyrate aminotransferase-like enzyme